MRIRLSFDAILAALAVASAGGLPACSRAENRIAPETTRPAEATATTPERASTAATATSNVATSAKSNVATPPPAKSAASSPRAVGPGVEIAPVRSERKTAEPQQTTSDQAACAAGACSPDMRKGH